MNLFLTSILKQHGLRHHAWSHGLAINGDFLEWGYPIKIIPFHGFYRIVLPIQTIHFWVPHDDGNPHLMPWIHGETLLKSIHPGPDTRAIVAWRREISYPDLDAARRNSKGVLIHDDFEIVFQPGFWITIVIEPYGCFDNWDMGLRDSIWIAFSLPWKWGFLFDPYQPNKQMVLFAGHLRLAVNDSSELLVPQWWMIYSSMNPLLHQTSRMPCRSERPLIIQTYTWMTLWIYKYRDAVLKVGS